MRKDGAQEILEHITTLVNETIVNDGSYNISLSKEDVLAAIDGGKSEGGPSGRHWILDPIDGTKVWVTEFTPTNYSLLHTCLGSGKVGLLNYIGIIE